jgi:hypothetical protein
VKHVYLYRETSTDEGTFGYLVYQGLWWYSLELPNRDNKRSISCIPPGEYICVYRYSPHFGRITFHLTDVEGRTYILIHGANFAGDVHKGYQSHLNGCIALGKGRGKIKNKFGKYQKAIFTSRFAVTEFMETIEDEEFKLTIEGG